jgi:hypothetical protein
VVELQNSFKEEPRFSPNLKGVFRPATLVGAAAEAQLWALASLWQTFATERVSDVQRRGSVEVENTLMTYLTKNGIHSSMNTVHHKPHQKRFKKHTQLTKNGKYGTTRTLQITKNGIKCNALPKAGRGIAGVLAENILFYGFALAECSDEVDLISN